MRVWSTIYTFLSPVLTRPHPRQPRGQVSVKVFSSDVTHVCSYSKWMYTNAAVLLGNVSVWQLTPSVPCSPSYYMPWLKRIPQPYLYVILYDKHHIVWTCNAECFGGFLFGCKPEINWEWAGKSRRMTSMIIWCFVRITDIGIEIWPDNMC